MVDVDRVRLWAEDGWAWKIEGRLGKDVEAEGKGVEAGGGWIQWREEKG